MTRDEIKIAILRCLGGVAPEADLSRLKPKVSFREQLDLDSMDFLNFVVALHESLRVEIPETDYPKLMALDPSIDYLLARLQTEQST